jgi:hypothetical protein
VAETAGAHRLPSAIAAALDDMCEDLERFQARHEQRLRLTRCISAADELIEDLEGLTLAGRPVVPAEWQDRLDRFAGALPPGVAGDLRTDSEPDRLLDQVFAIEERLYRLKLGEWALAFDAVPPPAVGEGRGGGDPAERSAAERLA